MNSKLSSLRLFVIILAAVCGFAVIFVLQKEENGQSIIIGCPSNTGGMVMNYAIENYCTEFIDIQNDELVSAYFMADCCAPKSGISLTSGELQGAVMCPDSAAALVEKDSRFIIALELTFNTEAVFFANGINGIDEAKKIGYMNGQERQKEAMKAIFSDEKEYIPVTASSLPYALALEEVEGAVLDFSTSLHMENDYFLLEPEKPTTVLVVSKDFYSSSQYDSLIQALEQSIEDLNEYDNFNNAIQFLNTGQISREEYDKWLLQGNKFLKRQSGAQAEKESG